MPVRACPGCVMQLDLEPGDKELLKRLLEQWLGTLRMEISNTENFEWRQALHDDETRIKRLIERLS